MSRLTCGAAAAFALVLGCAGQPASPPPAPPVPLAQAVAADPTVPTTSGSAAPAPAPPVLEVPAEPDPTGSRFGLIPLGTRLLASGSDDAPGLPFDLLRDPGSGEPRSDPVVVRLIREAADLWEIETVPVETGKQGFHCEAGGHPGLNRLALRAFVKKQDLLPVTSRRVELDLGRNTGVTIQAGVYLSRVGARYFAEYHGVPEQKFAVPGGSVGTEYTAEPNFAPAASNRGIDSNAPKRLMRLGNGAQFEMVQGSNFDGVSEVVGGYSAWIHADCARFRFFVPRQWMQVSQPSVPAEPAVPNAEDDPGGPRVIAGAPAFWPSGAPAGYVRAEQSFREDVREASGRRCLRKSILPVTAASTEPGSRVQYPEHDFVLCFDPKHVLGDRVPPAPRPNEIPLAALASKTVGTYLVEGEVASVYDCPPCPPRKRCRACEPPHMYFADGETRLKIWVEVPAGTPPGPPGAIARGNRLRIFVRVQSGQLFLERIESVLSCD